MKDMSTKPIASHLIIVELPYSGKFSMVQNFMELPLNPLEEIFVILTSCLLATVHCQSAHSVELYIDTCKSTLLHLVNTYSHGHSPLLSA